MSIGDFRIIQFHRWNLKSLLFVENKAMDLKGPYFLTSQNTKSANWPHLIGVDWANLGLTQIQHSAVTKKTKQTRSNGVAVPCIFVFCLCSSPSSSCLLWRGSWNGVLGSKWIFSWLMVFPDDVQRRKLHGLCSIAILRAQREGLGRVWVFFLWFSRMAINLVFHHANFRHVGSWLSTCLLMFHMECK